MPDSIIRQVEAMVTREKQDNVISFCNRLGDPISDSISAIYDSPGTTYANAAAGLYSDENDKNENDEYTNEGQYNGDNKGPGITLENQTHKYGENPDILPAEIPGVPANTTAPTESTGVPANEGSTGVPITGGNTRVLTEGSTGVHLEEDTDLGNNDGYNDNPPPPLARTANEDDSDDEDDKDVDSSKDIKSHHNETPDEEVCHPDSMTPSVQQTHGMRPRKPRDYSHMFSHATAMG
jgi:hypothetical protein